MDRGVEVVAINIASSYSLDEWRSFWKSVDNGEVLWAQDTDGSASRAYNIVFLGTTVVVDRQGYVTYRDGYATAYETLKSEIKKVL